MFVWSLLKITKGSIQSPDRQSSIVNPKREGEKVVEGRRYGKKGEGFGVGEGREDEKRGENRRKKGVLVFGRCCRAPKHLFKVSVATRQREISPFSPLRVRCSTLRDDPYPPKNFWGGGHLTISKVRLLISPIPHTPYPYPLTPPARYGTPCWI